MRINYSITYDHLYRMPRAMCTESTMRKMSVCCYADISHRWISPSAALASASAECVSGKPHRHHRGCRTYTRRMREKTGNVLVFSQIDYPGDWWPNSGRQARPARKLLTRDVVNRIADESLRGLPPIAGDNTLISDQRRVQLTSGWSSASSKAAHQRAFSSRPFYAWSHAIDDHRS